MRKPLCTGRCLTGAVLRRGFLALAILTLTLFAVGGHNRFEGPTILTIGAGHGVHTGDLPLVALAALALLVLAR